MKSNKLLKNKSFNLLIIGQVISLFGSLIQKFALSLYVLKLTGSGVQFASILAVSLIPSLVLGPICKVFVDWFDRRKIMIYFDLISGALIGGMFFLSVTNNLSLIHIYICVILLSIISSLYNPAVSTAIPSIVNKEDLIKANSVNNFVMTVGNIASPALAGILYGFYGISVIFLINSISFIFSSILEMFMKLPKVKKNIGNNILKEFTNDFIEGIKFIINKKIIFKLLCCSLIVNIVLNPVFSVGVPFLCKITLKVSDAQYGITETVIVAGTIIAPIFVTIISKKLKLTKLFYLVLIISGGLLGIMAIDVSNVFIKLFNSNSVPYIIFLIIGFAIGFLITMLSISLFTMIQQDTPNELLGRVNAAMGTITMCAIPLGQMLFGLMFDKLSSYLPILISSVVFILTAIIFNYSNKKHSE